MMSQNNMISQLLWICDYVNSTFLLIGGKDILFIFWSIFSLQNNKQSDDNQIQEWNN